ncbi:MAG: hypothetical protein A2539_02945 [Elusimicrobia bacterium RIFOXYD2_FULL_34_15]|nr:MAG: hypothetical protein A2539_02945 [Elusimicrobia bacterium RIFOXYD2_FULL_34_15]
MEGKFFVYILQSESDGTYYVGYSGNPEKRLLIHNSSVDSWSSRKKPWRIIYKEEFTNRSDAIIREKEIKRQKSRKFIEKLILSIGDVV